MKLVVLTAPSGAGKTTIARRLLKEIPGMRFSVSATTREARPNERDGVDYHFLDQSAFNRMVANGDFVEHEEVYPGLYYGTLKSELELATASEPILLDIDVRGARNVKGVYGPDARVIFIEPPSISVLEARLRRRADSDHSLQERIDRAHDEMAFKNLFDNHVVNDDLELAVAETIERVREFLSAPSANRLD